MQLQNGDIKNFRHSFFKFVFSEAGYDLGHLIAKSDQCETQTLSDDTFKATNIVGMNSTLNQNQWTVWEIFAQELARHHKRVVLCRGTVAKMENGNLVRLGEDGDGPVDITAFFQVAVVKDGPTALTAYSCLVPNEAVRNFQFQRHFPKKRLKAGKSSGILANNFKEKIPLSPKFFPNE